MSPDVLLRRGALVAIPVVVLALYLVRDRRPHGGVPAVASSVAPAERRPEVEAITPGLSERGEAALANEAKPPPEAPATAAAELPLADGPTLPKRTHHLHSSSGSPSAHEHASPCGGVEARVITASDDPAWAFASLTPGYDEPAVIRHVGDRIGGWQVDKIEWDRVWLRGGRGRCAVSINFGAREGLEEAADAGLSRHGKHAVLYDVPDPGEPWRVPGEIANSIDKVRETEFAIERAMVQPIFDRAGALFYGLHIEPAKQGDEVVGLTLGEVKTDSLLERLGLETGDVVLAIDDQPAKSLDAVVKALSDARDHDKLVARLERAGESFELRVDVR